MIEFKREIVMKEIDVDFKLSLSTQSYEHDVDFFLMHKTSLSLQ